MDIFPLLVQVGKLIAKNRVDEVFFSYSDVSYGYVMHRSAIVNAAGAGFTLLGPNIIMYTYNIWRIYKKIDK